MTRSPIGRFVLAIAVAALLGPLAQTVSAQNPPGFPGTPSVIVHSDRSATITFAPAQDATSYSIHASYEGVLLQGSPFPIGNLVQVLTPQLPPGSYNISIIAINGFGQSQGTPTEFIVPGLVPGPTGAPGIPRWRQADADGSTVNLVWEAGPGPPATSYEIEALIQRTGQIIILPVGNQLSLAVPNVPVGNFLVRIRGRNAFGVGLYSDRRIIYVGITLGSGDMQVTMTWNTLTDIDIHVIEPSGTHVYYAAKNGPTARLDVDNVTGFGPENIFVDTGAAVTGTYQVFLVHYGGSPTTTVTVTIRLFGGTANETVAFFTRQTNFPNPALGYSLADVDIGAGTITPRTGTRVSADEREGGAPPKPSSAKGGS